MGVSLQTGIDGAFACVQFCNVRIILNLFEIIC